jgi:hypothetical protein
MVPTEIAHPYIRSMAERLCVLTTEPPVRPSRLDHMMILSVRHSLDDFKITCDQLDDDAQKDLERLEQAVRSEEDRLQGLLCQQAE